MGMFDNTEDDVNAIKEMAWNVEVALRKRINALEKGIQDWLDGDFDHPRKYRGTTGKCPHGVWYYEDCNACDTAHFERVLQSS